MRFLEELQMNALPALQTYLYDGWIIRFADGYTNRANSVNPIYTPNDEIDRKISHCEKLITGKNLNPTYKITPFVQPENLDNLLADRGYNAIHFTSVQTLEINNICQSTVGRVVTEHEFNEVWFDYYCQFGEMSARNQGVSRQILKSIVPQKFYTYMLLDDKVVALGMAVVEKGYIGLFDISVAENYRNMGLGMQLILNMLNTGKTLGVKNAYLQVMLNNAPALHLYNKLGFREVYKYHYRVLVK